MPETPPNAPPPASPPATPNVHEFTVSEISGALKRTVEDAFGHVRVRGELGRVSRPASGHVYLDLKDDKAVLNGVIWKGTAGRLKIAPEQGLEVVVTGRLTTFPGQSRYQIVIESMEPAGVGALMALLEERRKKLAAEGLFDEARKKPLPYLPEVIGVVTSPSGAVIRDILHRLADRFPRHVLIWPVPVQGEGAADQVADAIRGFNALTGDSAVPRPDLLIVARGGGSIEDLWAFNEEVVVRAAAASSIPLISAVGHETDTTLIDFAADRRAPTPTAAAEMAVPVRSELRANVLDLERRLVRGTGRLAEEASARLSGLARALPRAEELLALPSQRFDSVSGRLRTALALSLKEPSARYGRVAGRLHPGGLKNLARQGAEGLRVLTLRGRTAYGRQVERARDRLTSQGKLLESLGYTQTLARGFALVHRADGGLLRRASEAEAGEAVELQFEDGRLPAILGDTAGDTAGDMGGEGGTGGETSGGPKPARTPKPEPSASGQKGKTKQGSLF